MVPAKPAKASGAVAWLQMDLKETTGLIFDLEWRGAVKPVFPGQSTQAKKTQNPAVLLQAALGADSSCENEHLTL